jgi:hypothetical protein
MWPAAALSDGLGREIKATVMPPDAALAAGTLALDPKFEELGRPPVTLVQWARRNRDRLRCRQIHFPVDFRG